MPVIEVDDFLSGIDSCIHEYSSSTIIRLCMYKLRAKVTWIPKLLQYKGQLFCVCKIDNILNFKHIATTIMFHCIIYTWNGFWIKPSWKQNDISFRHERCNGKKWMTATILHCLYKLVIKCMVPKTAKLYALSVSTFSMRFPISVL